MDWSRKKPGSTRASGHVWFCIMRKVALWRLEDGSNVSSTKTGVPARRFWPHRRLLRGIRYRVGVRGATNEAWSIAVYPCSPPRAYSNCQKYCPKWKIPRSAGLVKPAVPPNTRNPVRFLPGSSCRPSVHTGGLHCGYCTSRNLIQLLL